MLRKVALGLTAALLVASPLAAQDWARKMFQTTEHDFGTVARAAKSEFDFTFSNLYLEDIHIAGVRSSCGCTSPEVVTPNLKTYEKGIIRAKFNTASFLGQRGATLTVTIDKPYYAEVQLHVRGNIRSDVVIQPGSVQFGEVDQGQALEQRVTVNYAGWGTWKVVDVKSSNPNLSATVAETSRVGGQVAYQVTVRLDAKAPAGYLSDHLMLVTNDSSGSQIPLPVEGRVVSGITVSPASLFMGVVKPGEEVTKSMIVRGKKPFKILSITCDDKSFRFGKESDTSAKTVHVIPVTFAADKSTGKVTKQIKIETDLGQTIPELSAYAVVAAPQGEVTN